MRLAFADPLHFRGMQGIDLRPTLAAVLVAHAAGQADRLGEDLLQGIVASNPASSTSPLAMSIMSLGVGRDRAGVCGGGQASSGR